MKWREKTRNVGFFVELKPRKRLFERRSPLMSTLCKYIKLIATNKFQDKSLGVIFGIEKITRKERAGSART